MEDDNLYPTDSTYFGWNKEPEGQVSDRKKEKAETLKALSVIDLILKHLDERIRYRDTIDSINVNLDDDPIMHQKKCETNQMVKLALEAEKQLLEDLLDTHKR